jgi:hypothetical protein
MIRPKGFVCMNKFWFLLVIGLLWSEVDTCLMRARPEQRSDTPQANSTLGEDEILETVFRYQIDHCYRRLPRKVYFLSYRQTDPTDSLMERFGSYGTLVRKYSERREFYKQRTGGRGVLLGIASIESKNDTILSVEGSCGLGGLEGSSYVYRVEKKDGKWRVKSQRRTGFS